MADEELLNDLLWALWAIARLAYPMSIADFCDMMGQPSLAAEYAAVATKWWPKSPEGLVSQAVSAKVSQPPETIPP